MKRLTSIIASLILIGMFALLAQGCEEQQTGNPNPNVPIAQQMNFVGDKSVMVYHYPECKKCPHESNVVPLDCPLSAVRGGFKPCKYCKPPKE